MANMREDIQTILEAAIRAPSGDNVQPWRFRVEENKIEIFNVPERDQSLYNFRQNASYVAHGGLIENILIASSHAGYHATVNLFPDPVKLSFVAKIILQKAAPHNEPLCPFITKRCTNRKPYKLSALSEDQKKELLSAVREISGGSVIFIEDEEKKRMITDAASLNERLVFETKSLHRFFFAHLRWTKKEENEKRNGLYLKTLELTPQQSVAFQIFKHWSVLQFFNVFGLSKMVARENAKTYMASSVLGAIIISSGTAEDFIFCGRLMQRVWLTATKLGLSMQLLTGITFLMQRILAKDTADLSLQQTILLGEAYEKMEEAFNVQEGTIAMLFRVGFSDAPSGYSSRLPLAALLQDER